MARYGRRRTAARSTFGSASLRMSRGRKAPFSVTIPVMRRAGVTSKAGFSVATPSGAIWVLPKTCVISRPFRCSIGIWSPMQSSGRWSR